MMEYQVLLSFQIAVVLVAELLILLDSATGPWKKWYTLNRNQVELERRIKKIRKISRGSAKNRTRHDILLDLYLRPMPEEDEALRRARNFSMIRVVALIIAPWLGTSGLVHLTELLSFI